MFHSRHSFFRHFCSNRKMILSSSLAGKVHCGPSQCNTGLAVLSKKLVFECSQYRSVHFFHSMFVSWMNGYLPKEVGGDSTLLQGWNSKLEEFHLGNGSQRGSAEWFKNFTRKKNSWLNHFSAKPSYVVLHCLTCFRSPAIFQWVLKGLR